eukprot:scaffold16060_cov107-Isochrysis_galbana.AAC.8
MSGSGDGGREESAASTSSGAEGAWTASEARIGTDHAETDSARSHSPTTSPAGSRRPALRGVIPEELLAACAARIFETEVIFGGVQNAR